MSYDYFYGQSGELFSYFRIPKALFQDCRFRQLSTDARTLYGILLDRMSLSVKNGWLDEQGRVYIIYTVREVQESLCCAEHKAVKLFRELEDIDLIERKRRGLGRPSLIYVKDFSSGLPKAQVQNCPNSNSGAAESAILVQPKPQANKTDKNKTEWNDPDPIYSGGIREQLEDYFYQSLEEPIQPGDGILHHAEGVDLIPANIELAGMEVALVNSMNREKMLKQVLDSAKREYDYILLDCTPSLGMLTINALAAADTTLIPMQAQYLSAKGLEQLLQTIGKVRRQINPKLKIEGILLTMTDSRTTYGKQIDNLIRQGYGRKIHVFEQTIPHSVRAAEISTTGESIYQHDPKGKVAAAYQSLTREVLANAEKQRKLSSERIR